MGAASAAPLNPIIIGVGGAGVEVLSTRYAENLIGVCEVTFVVPADAPAGDNIPFAAAVDSEGSRLDAQATVISVR